MNDGSNGWFNTYIKGVENWPIDFWNKCETKK